MAERDLPNWVYDLVNDLDTWRNEHPGGLYRETDNGYGRVESCGCHALEHVPLEVIEGARAIRRYNESRAAASEANHG